LQSMNKFVALPIEKHLISKVGGMHVNVGYRTFPQPHGEHGNELGVRCSVWS
jgi:hypothetical protein